MNCFKCNKELMEYGDLHPHLGLHFFTYGHYGSRFFDPMNHSTLNILICDKCLENSNQWEVRDYD